MFTFINWICILFYGGAAYLLAHDEQWFIAAVLAAVALLFIWMWLDDVRQRRAQKRVR